MTVEGKSLTSLEVCLEAIFRCSALYLLFALSSPSYSEVEPINFTAADMGGGAGRLLPVEGLA